MTLQSFGISNFKAFGQALQRMPLKPITLIFGPNSAGKSSLVQSFLWALNSAKTGDFESRSSEKAFGSVDLPGFRSLLHRQEMNRRVEVEIVIVTQEGEPTVKIVHHLGLPSREELQNMEEKIISGYPLVLEYEQESKSVTSCESLFEELFTWDKPAQEQIEAWLEDDDALQKLIDGAIEIEAAADRIAFNGKVLGPEDFRGIFLKGQKSSARLKELAAHWDDIAVIQNQVEAKLEIESQQISLRLIEIYCGGELALKAGKILGKDNLQIELLDESILSKIPEPKDNWVEQMFLQTQKKAFSKTFFKGYQVTLPDLENFQKIPGPQIAKVMGWLRTSMDAAKDMEENLVYLEPLRHLPKRRELLGPPGEQSADPALMPWLRMRDDKALKDLINNQFKKLSAQLYEFQTRVYATPRDVWEQKDNFGAICWSKTDHSHPLWLDGITGGIGDPDGSHPSFESMVWDDENHAYAKLDDELIKNKGVALLVDLQIKDLRSQAVFAVRDVGVGISQIAPFLVHACGNQNKTIIIEQPEIHIHPKLQAELGDVFIETALGENKNTFLLETHSEHLILRILRRIRETTEGEINEWPEALRNACPNGIRPQDVAVLYVQPGHQGAEVIELPVDANGEFTCEWPGGFFEERLKEFF